MNVITWKRHFCFILDPYFLWDGMLLLSHQISMLGIYAIAIRTVKLHKTFTQEMQSFYVQAGFFQAGYYATLLGATLIEMEPSFTM